ncbi:MULTISPECIES: hypothetical protein [Pseudomonas]|uniref:hypothetical protein n=1 Tax=Pseudomonas TaxID=286 RepID=UPI000C88373D|nr:MULTISPECIES: hypothetical protein [Pseudomonas]PMY37420.1 hypothetical protein C1Y36_28435 [Pseudomonas sp. FW306-2-2C-D06C]PYC42131.1 hypothetical protein DMW99_01890 [Pseudomonas chlororaphis]
MSQISIPYVAYHFLEPQLETVAPLELAEAVKLPPELYIDDEHHGRVYCPDCGVMCSRRPRKSPKRKDGVDAFYFHLPGFDTVECPHRKKSGPGGGGDEGAKERRAISLVTFAGWKSLAGDDESEDDDDQVYVKPRKKEVQNGSSVSGRGGFENIFDADGNLLNPGRFRTVGRLVQLAQISLNIAIQFEGEDAILLRDLIVSIEKVQRNIKAYLGKSFLFFGQPTSIVKGKYNRVFFNFKSPEHELSGHCELDIFEARGWKTFERDRYYLFYGMVEGDEGHSIVRVLEAGQIDRVPSTARQLFDGLR